MHGGREGSAIDGTQTHTNKRNCWVVLRILWPAGNKDVVASLIPRQANNKNLKHRTTINRSWEMLKWCQNSRDDAVGQSQSFSKLNNTQQKIALRKLYLWDFER